MKLVLLDELNFLVYLNTFYTKNIDFSKKDNLEPYFKNLFLNLKENYNMPLAGYYNITIYQDKNYGVILEINKEDLEYFDYFGGQIDMRIAIPENSFFLYQIDIFNLPKEIKGVIYFYKGNFYLHLKEKIAEPVFLKMLEWAKIVYGAPAEEIVKKGKIWKEETI